MRIRKTFSGESDVTDINISPLIDMVFILLIFFIVTTVFVEEKGMPVNRPQPDATSNLDKENVLIELTSTGQVVYNGNSLGVGGVVAVIKNAIQREQVPVLIDVQQGAISNTVVRVIDEARQAGAENISLTSSE